MAGDTEDLVLSISADVRQMQRALQRLTGDTARTTAIVQKQFNSLGDVGGAAFDKVAANSNAAAGAIQNSARRIATSMNASRFQTANLAAQLNDIGVQLQSGTSPFSVAIQQGAQINQILGATGVRGAVSLLGGAFASLINPVSLATIAIITLGGAAVQYFTAMLSDSSDTEKTLKEQAKLIEDVAARWGDAVPALREYVDEQNRLKEQGELRDATKLRIEDIFKEAKESAGQLRLELVDLVAQLQDAGASENEIVRVQRAFEAFTEAVNQNRDSTAENKELLSALSAVYINSGVPAANDFAASIYNIADAFAAFAAQAAEAQAQAEAAIQAANVAEFQKTLPGNLGQLSPLSSANGSFINEAELQTVRANATKSQTQLAAERAARAGAGDRNAAAREAERERQAIADLIDQLEFEQSLIGASDEQRAVANALRRAGAAATDEQRARIESLVVAIDQEKEALRQSEEAMKALQDIGRDFLGGFIQDLRQGKSASEALANALQRVSDRLLDMALNSIFDGGGGNILSMLGFGGGFPAAPRAGVGLYHSGGVAGQPRSSRQVPPGIFAGAPRYHNGGVAGLRPDEVPAILQRGEVITPRGGAGARSGVHVTVGISADGNGNLMPFVESVSRKQAAGVVARAAPTIINASKSSTFKDLGRGGADGILGARYGVRPQVARKT